MSDIQFATLIKDRDGADIIDDGAPLTLARACIAALDAILQADQGEGLKPKLHRGRLIDEISRAAKAYSLLQLEAEDIKVIKDRIALVAWPASIVRSVCLLLDPATKE